MSAARRRAIRRADVVLVSMPFGELLSPSMGLSLLKGHLTRDGVPSVIRYFGLPFAQRIGGPLYRSLAADGRFSARYLAGEWLFAGALFDRAPDADDRYVAEILRSRSGWIAGGEAPLPAATIARLRRARARVPAFLDQCADEVLAAGPRLVGFTSVFQQHTASLALAARLKARDPSLVIVFGGSNCEGVMGAETVRQFSCVDAAVSGEADLVIAPLVRRVLDGQPLDGLEGVLTRCAVTRQLPGAPAQYAPAVRDMDALPYPEFDDFFDELAATNFGAAWQPRLFFETSRGCWWGEKRHCTFCGLNGQTMAFRSKSGGRALEELTQLVERYPGCDVQVVDNILDMRYFQDLLPELARRRLDVELFYETKANLKKEQVALLRAAGVTEIQPGIESFSDRVLELMRKGVSALQNVQLLKWCTEIGVRPYWNVLWGFPGEPPEDYARMAALVPRLTHLVPPVGFAGLRLDRFSPNFFDAERLGFRDVRPLPAYAHVYPLPAPALANLAYHFTFAYADGRQVETYVPPLVEALRAWVQAEGTSALFAVDLGHALIVGDTRPAAAAPLFVLAGIDRALYQQCDAIADVRRLVEAARASVPEADEAWVEARLAPLCEAGLLLRDGRRYLALAVAAGEASPPAGAVTGWLSALAAIAPWHDRALDIPLTAWRGTSISCARAESSSGARRGRTPRAVRLTPDRFSCDLPYRVVVRCGRVTPLATEGAADGQEGARRQEEDRDQEERNQDERRQDERRQDESGEEEPRQEEEPSQEEDAQEEDAAQGVLRTGPVRV